MPTHIIVGMNADLRQCLAMVFKVNHVA